MRTYELVLVFKTGDEDKRKKLLETVKSWLDKPQDIEEKDMGSKALAYKIKGELMGHFYDFIFKSDKIQSELERRLLINEEILRYLFLRKDK